MHAFLASLPVDAAITTNYDDLWEKAYTATKLTVPRAARGRSAPRKKLSILPYKPLIEADCFLLKMHGCVHHPQDIVITRQDYVRYAKTRAVLGAVLQSAMMNKHLLYVGFSFAGRQLSRHDPMS